MRSAASGFIRPYRDAPWITLPIRWYVVPDTSPYLSLDTCFFWDQWPKQEPTVYPAIEDAYKWNSGKSSGNPVGLGICGSKDQWLNGCLTTDVPPAIDPLTGLPVCCLTPGGGPLVAAGLATMGVAVSGSGTVP
jgi:hypothetical protein